MVRANLFGLLGSLCRSECGTRTNVINISRVFGIYFQVAFFKVGIEVFWFNQLSSIYCFCMPLRAVSPMLNQLWYHLRNLKYIYFFMVHLPQNTLSETLNVKISCVTQPRLGTIWEVHPKIFARSSHHSHDFIYLTCYQYLAKTNAMILPLMIHVTS